MVKILATCIVLFISITISRYFGRDCSERTGSNIAGKHLKDEWGMEEKKEYHD